jgi:flagellar biosynthetic protein FliP
MRHHPGETSIGTRVLPAVAALIAAVAFIGMSGARADEPAARVVNPPRALDSADAIGVNRPAAEPDALVSGLLRTGTSERDLWKTVETVALFGLISLAPMGLLMVTAFVRINVVLILLRQALGSPQVPGNQVLTALSFLLTALVMWPIGEKVYHDAVVPYKAKQIDLARAWTAGTEPIRAFMVDQIQKTNHEDYLQAMQDYAAGPSAGRSTSEPARVETYSLRVVAPAYLLSELTTALLMGFYVYLPFLVIDLVVSSVLAATGLFMLPPSLVATPIKLIVFVLADGWILIATMLLSSFAAGAGGP